VRNGFGDVIRQANPDTGVTDYTYDARGLVTQVKDSRNVVADMTYDTAGRIVTRAFPAATAENVTFPHDSIASSNMGKGRALDERLGRSCAEIDFIDFWPAATASHPVEELHGGQ
jgi:YD repeat-containing protein